MSAEDLAALLAAKRPFDLLAPELREAATVEVVALRVPKGGAVLNVGDRVDGLFIVAQGAVDLVSPEGETVAELRAGDHFGERGLLRDGHAPNAAMAREDSRLYMLQRSIFEQAMSQSPEFARFFDYAAPRRAGSEPEADPLLSTPISELMTAEPITVEPGAAVREAARIIRDRDISCLPVTSDGRLVGILTTGDLADRVIAEGLGAETLVGDVMTADPMTVASSSLAFDALVAMTERRITHLPVVDGGRLTGVLTSTNLVRRQSVAAAFLVGDIQKRDDYAGFREVVGRIPKMLAQLVGSGTAAHDVGRIVTSVADALTRRLLALGEERLGAPPVAYLWAACGSQGRREQTGVSDQDNCLILSDEYDAAAHGPYFAALAKYVSDGLHEAGYYYCPGDMMATADRWRQPVRVWRGYFDKWIRQPDEEAQMLASVMFDLRAIAGDASLFEGLQEQVLARAKANSIFRAHMVKNSLKHRPPLGLFGGMALIGSGEHKNSIDMKHAGVVPIVDLGRAYALMGGFTVANTRERLVAARDGGVISQSGGSDLLDAFDLISDMRLEHQARLIRDGAKPDNFMSPASLSELERNHLKDSFAVVKTMQSAAANKFSMGG